MPQRLAIRRDFALCAIERCSAHQREGVLQTVEAVRRDLPVLNWQLRTVVFDPSYCADGPRPL